MKIVGINDEFSSDHRQTWHIFSDPFEYYCGEEDTAGGQSMLKHKAAELLLEEKKIIRV